MRRGLCAVLVVAGCWSQDSLIDGTFTPEQWAQLKADFHYSPVTPCSVPNAEETALAEALFSDTRLSGGQCMLAKTPCWSDSDCTAMANDTCPAWTPTSCKTCHDPKNGWIDSRTPNNVSAWSVNGKVTKRNAMTLWDVAFKPQGKEYTWSGAYPTSGGVLDLAIKTPMSSTHAHVVSVVMNDPNLQQLYFGAFPGAWNTELVFTNLEAAFTAYFCTSPFISGMTPFDWWLAGKDSPMTDSAKRGFAVFVGKGTCITCHSGPTFTDYGFHNTSVPQEWQPGQPPVPLTDNGLGDVTMDPADDGKFETGMLREIAKTGPYMHDGAKQTLADVVAFYRQGGGVPAEGTRDPKIEPLDLTDQDAQDLVAFLNSLTQCDGTSCPMTGGGGPGGPSGPAPDGGLPPPPDAMSACGPGNTCPAGFTCTPQGCACGPVPPLMLCNDPTSPFGVDCSDPQTDPKNCGMCGNVCASGICMMGMCAGACVPQTCTSLNAQCGTVGDGCGNLLNCGACAPGLTCNPGNQCGCGPGTTLCGSTCVDLLTDKNNCGMCGHACTGSHTCMNGACI